jgi:hypothetical protein
MRKTKIILLYNDENISQFKHPDIIPYKLENQTVYFESQAFDEIVELPYSTNIGFITPSFFKKQNLTLDELFEHVNRSSLKSTLFLVPLMSNPIPGNRIESMTEFHGPAFKTIWVWLLGELGYSQYSDADFAGGSSNMWVAPRDFVVKFLVKAKQAIYLCNNAPEHIKTLLYSDPHYEGNAKHLMMEKFGIPHYPFHPFIMENLISFLTYLNHINKF